MTGSRLANTWVQDVSGYSISQKAGTLWNAENEFFLPTVPDTMWPVASTKRLLDTGADDARDDHESKRHKNSEDTVPMAQETSSRSGVKRSNLEAIRRADAEAEKSFETCHKVLEERRAAETTICNTDG